MIQAGEIAGINQRLDYPPFFPDFITPVSPSGDSTLRSAPSLIANDFEHRFRVRRLLERLPKFGLVKKLGNIRQRVKMLLKLPLGDKEQHDQIHRLII